MYKVVLTAQAQRVFESVDSSLAKKLSRCFARLESDPRRGNNIKSLKGPFAGFLRYRAGGWRVVYSINDATQTVSIITIANRRDVYD